MARFGGGVHLISPSSAVAETTEFQEANDEDDPGAATARDSLQGDDHDDAYHAIRYSLDEADCKANVARSTLMIVAPTIGTADDVEGTLGPVRGPRIVDKSRWNQVRIHRRVSRGVFIFVVGCGLRHTPERCHPSLSDLVSILLRTLSTRASPLKPPIKTLTSDPNPPSAVPTLGWNPPVALLAVETTRRKLGALSASGPLPDSDAPGRPNLTLGCALPDASCDPADDGCTAAGCRHRNVALSLEPLRLARASPPRPGRSFATRGTRRAAPS